MDCSPPGSSIHRISQTRILEWVVISFSRGSSWPRDWTHVSCIGRWLLDHWATKEAQKATILQKIFQIYIYRDIHTWASQAALVVKYLPDSTGDVRDMGLIPGSGSSPGGEHGNPLQYSHLENPTSREAWRAIIHKVTNSQTRLKQLSMHTGVCIYIYVYTHIHIYIKKCPSLLFITVFYLKSTLSDINIDIPALFRLQFCREFLSPPLQFHSLCVLRPKVNLL